MTIYSAFLVLLLYALHPIEHIPQIKIQNPCRETVDGEACSTFVFFSILVIFIVVVEEMVLFRQHLAQILGVFFASFGLLMAIAIGSCGQITIQLGSVGRIKQLLGWPCRNFGADAVEQDGSIERNGDSNSGNGDIARDEIILP